MFGKCKHEIKYLDVRKSESNITVKNRYETFSVITTYHFTCRNCGEYLTLDYQTTLPDTHVILKG